MTAIQRHLDSYFGSLNSITKKIWRDKELYKQNYPGNFDQLEADEQEDLLERHLVDPKVKDKYRHAPREPTPEVFPRVKVNCGEKIVVDFENDDGWTWTDEHSGPFSWMTKSQQDLSLADLDSLEDQMKKAKTSRGKSHSPDREVAARRPREQAYNNHDKGTNAEAASTADEIFQKFGIAFSFGKDEEDLKNPSDVEQQTLISTDQQEYENANFVLDDEALGFDRPEEDDRRSLTPYDNNRYQGDDSISDYYTGSDIGSRPTSNNSSGRSQTDTRQHKQSPTSHNQSEAEMFLMSSSDQDLDDSHGHVSPVYLQEPGESSTDQQFSYTTPEEPTGFSLEDVVNRNSTVISEQPTSSYDLLMNSNSVSVTEPSVAEVSEELGQWNQGLDDSKDEEVDTANDSSTKTGFDFLDNW